jgi:hypothetical protein
MLKPTVIIQRRFPTYDVVLRTERSCDYVRKRLEAAFEQDRQPLRGLHLSDPRIHGAFESNSTFVVKGFRVAFVNAPMPFVDGHLLARDANGCDILIRTRYGSAAWLANGVFLTVPLGFATAEGGVEGLVVAGIALSFLLLFVFAPLHLVAHGFATRIEKLLS